MSKNLNNDIYFSVVIPLYNKERGIIRALTSVLNQDYKNYEIIVVNDGSTDNSIKSIQPFSNKIILIDQQNAGVSAARNTGIMHAKYKYIAFLDADDEWHTHFLESIRNMIIKHPDAGIYCTNYLKVLGNKKELAVQNMPEGINAIPYLYHAARTSSPVHSSSVCIPKDIILKTGMFPAGIKLYEDLFVWIKISLDYPVIFFNQPLSTYFRDAENRACNNIIPGINDLPFIKLIDNAIANNKLDARQLIDAHIFINKYTFLNVFKMITGNKKKEARKILGEIKTYEPKESIRKYLLLLFSLTPQFVIKSIWLIGKKIKTHLL